MIVGVAIVLYAVERIPLELTSLSILSVMLVFFHVFPISGRDGRNLLDAGTLLQGFANPALVSVLALLVVTQGVARTGALDRGVGVIIRLAKGNTWAAIALTFGTIFVTSMFVHNTPVVVMFVPMLETLSRRLGLRTSQVMIPLSFVAILAGMTTLIGSSTNLLVSGALVQFGHEPLGFFDFTLPGLLLAAVGLIYLMVVGVRLLPARDSPADRLTAGPRRHFVLQATVTDESGLVGAEAHAHLLRIRGARLILLQRGEQAMPAPFRFGRLRAGDLLVLLVTREAMEQAMVRYPKLLRTASLEAVADNAEPRRRGAGERVLAEVMIAPGSRLIGQTLEEVGFHSRFGCLVLGIERRAHVIRHRLTEVRLEAGDVLVIEGAADDIERFRATRNLILLDGSAAELPVPALARRAALIFVAVVAVAALEIVPVAVAAVAGAAPMIVTGVLDLQRAAWAIDRRIILLVGSAFALGAALEHTGAAAFLARQTLGPLGSLGPAVVVSALFLVVALMTNVIANNAAAILFTPIAVEAAQALQTDPFFFALAVLFGANCSFATPIGYQTNLLVMGPGHYRFTDFVKVGTPLVVLLWIAFSLLALWRFGVG